MLEGVCYSPDLKAGGESSPVSPHLGEAPPEKHPSFGVRYRHDQLLLAAFDPHSFRRLP